MKYSFVFVCQGGSIEVKSAILAASLIRQLKCDFELIAAVPKDLDYLQPNQKTLDFLTSLEVSLVNITNPFDTSYPIGNKLACLSLNACNDKTVFLDSDIICLSPFHHHQRFEDYQINAKLEDWHHHEMSEWEMLYDYLDLPILEPKYNSTVFNEAMPLYCNTGFIAVHSSINFGENWINLARNVDRNLPLPRKRPNLDQLTFPVVIHLNNYSYDLLDESYNFPGELRPLNHHDLPIFCHYHDAHMILCDALLCQYVQQLAEDHQQLKRILLSSDDELWHMILRKP